MQLAEMPTKVKCSLGNLKATQAILHHYSTPPTKNSCENRSLHEFWSVFFPVILLTLYFFLSLSIPIRADSAQQLGGSTGFNTRWSPFLAEHAHLISKQTEKKNKTKKPRNVWCLLTASRHRSENKDKKKIAKIILKQTKNTHKTWCVKVL